MKFETRGEDSMKKTLLFVVVLLAARAIQAQTGNKMSGGVEKAIEKMEQQWTEAGKASNAEAVSPMLADKYTNLLSDGTLVDKAKTLENIKKSKWEINEISDVKVTAFGNTAIATGSWRGKGTDQDGKAVDAHERFVDTWTKMPDGKWQCVASGGAPVKM
jgi:ketosteroid isomerase-like protein